MMATALHVTAWAGRTKYQADGFLFGWVYNEEPVCASRVFPHSRYSSKMLCALACFVTRGYRGQARPQSNYCRLWRRAQGVNLFVTRGFVTIQASLFLLGQSHFCFSSTAYFLKKCVTRNEILHFVSQNNFNVRHKNKIVTKSMPDNNLLTRYRLYQRDVSIYSFNQQMHTIVIWFAIMFLKMFTPLRGICVPLGNYAAYSVNSLPTFRDTLSIPLQGSRILDPWRWDR